MLNTRELKKRNSFVPSVLSSGNAFQHSSISNIYHRELSRFVQEGSERTLLNAYELGRSALNSGKGVLDILEVHKAEMNNLPDRFVKNQISAQTTICRSNRFLEEVMSPFEVSRLSSLDSISALRGMHKTIEEESTRVAHLLHDDTAQILTAVYMELAEFSRKLSTDSAKELVRVYALLDEVCERLRDLAHELRPMVLDHLGLSAAVQSLADGIGKRSGLPVVVDSSIDMRYPRPIEMAIYRTVQQSLANCAKHALAQQVDIKLWQQADNLVCTVRDDGVGFDTADLRKSTGLGLLGVNERVKSLNGICHILSTPGKGTEIKVVIPL